MRTASIGFVLLLAGCSFSPPDFEGLGDRTSGRERTVRVFLDSYVAWIWSAFPDEASASGIHEFDHALGGQGESHTRARLTALRYYLADLDELESAGLPDSLKLDLIAGRMDMWLRVGRLERALRGPGFDPLVLVRGVRSLAGNPNLDPADRAGSLAVRVERGAALYSALPPSRQAELRSLLKDEKILGLLPEADSGSWTPTAAGPDAVRNVVSVVLEGTPDPALDIVRLLDRADDWRTQVRKSLLTRLGKGRAGEDLRAELERIRTEETDFDPTAALAQLRAFTNQNFITVSEVSLATKAGAGRLDLSGPFEPTPFGVLPIGDVTRSDLAREAFPGRFTRALHLREVQSTTRRLARNPALDLGYPLLAEYAIAVGRSRFGPTASILTEHNRLRALSRLVGGIRFHAKGIPFDALIRFFETEAFLSPEAARIEAETVAQSPEVMVEPLGAQFLSNLRTADSSGGLWARVLGLGGLPLRAIWKVEVGSEAPAAPFTGPIGWTY